MAIIYGTIPDAAALASFDAQVVRNASWVDIYEADNITPWRTRVGFVGGTVSVDMARDSRRNLDIELSDTNDDLTYGPDGFWYDKILKPFRGVVLANGDEWVTALGEFLPDTIERPNFPKNMRVSCRDFTKKLMLDRFSGTTTFAAATEVGSVIKAIATNGGIVKFNFPSTTNRLLAEGGVTFERGTERWKSMADLATSIGWEIFFDAYGYLTLRPFVDPLTAPVSHTFRTGATSNLADFTRSTSDTFLFNDVLVYGDNQRFPLVFGRAENTNPSSPTRISRIGRRTHPPITNQFVTDNSTANSVASSFLKVMALEQYDVNVASVVAPWLEAGSAVEALLPASAPGEPTRYLLSSMTLPLGLGTMSGVAKRVTIVG